MDENPDSPNLEELASDEALPVPEATEGSANGASEYVQMPPPSIPPTPRNRKRSRVQDDRLEKAFSILEKSAMPQEENECQIFGKLIAKKLQGYSSEIRSTVQEQIMKIIFDADRGNYARYQYPQPVQYPIETSHHPFNLYNYQQQSPFNCSGYMQQNSNLVASQITDQPPSPASTSTLTPLSSPNINQYYESFSPATPGTSGSKDSRSSHNSDYED